MVHVGLGTHLLRLLRGLLDFVGELVDRLKARRAGTQSRRVESSRVESSRGESSRVESSRVEGSRVKSKGVDSSRGESSRVELSRVESRGGEGSRVESSRVESRGVEGSRVVPSTGAWSTMDASAEGHRGEGRRHLQRDSLRLDRRELRDDPAVRRLRLTRFLSCREDLRLVRSRRQLQTSRE